MKRIQKGFILLFVLMLALPLVFTNFRPNQVSALDNRNLQEFPQLNGAFSKALNTYFQDRIGFREKLLNVHVTINDKLFHELEHINYYYGQDDHIFFEMAGMDIVNKDIIDEEYLTNFADFVERVEGYCADRDVPFLFMLNPMKSAVYTEELPKGMQYRDIRMTRLHELLDERGVRYLSVKDILRSAKERFPVMNKQYDVNHWNDNGAFSTFSAIIDTLREDDPSIQALREDWFEKETLYFDTLPNSTIKISDNTENYILKDSHAERVYTYDNVIWSDPSFLSVPYYQHYVNQSNPDAPRILIFAGSYYGQREKFLTESFSELMFVRNYWNVFNIDYYFNIFQPDIVLFAAAQHTLFDTYFPQYGLAHAAYQPAYEAAVAGCAQEAFAGIDNTDWTMISGDVSDAQSSLVDLGWDVTGERITYAYALSGDRIYDLKISVTEGRQYVYATFPKEGLAENTFAVVLVDPERKLMNTIWLSK